MMTRSISKHAQKANKSQDFKRKKKHKFSNLGVPTNWPNKTEKENSDKKEARRPQPKPFWHTHYIFDTIKDLANS